MSKHRVLVIMSALALGLVSATPATSQSVARPGSAPSERGVDDSEAPPESAPDEGSDLDNPQFADQQILDDLIVVGSACVGQDCVNGESFGFDTIRVKENNLRIKFQDTSTSASFPSNDWELTANDSSNGGLNHFSITDISGGRIPFRVEAGARTNALYVESDGDIGIGTSNPVVDMHVVTGNTPTVRLEQDGSSGFTSQTWDLASNETNFFIRDASNGSKLPFRIRPGAPTSAIDVAANGNVGIGTSSPDAPIDIERAGTANLRLTATGAGTWEIQGSGDGLSVRDDTNARVPFFVDANGNVGVNTVEPAYIFDIGDTDRVRVGLTSVNGDDWDLITDNSGTQQPGFTITRRGNPVRSFRVTPDGAIVIARDAAQPPSDVVHEGAIYYDGDSFCGFDGSTWIPLNNTGDQTCS